MAQNNLNKATSGLNQAIERLSTGYKINHAGDNAANYSIANDMTTKLSSYQVAEDNVGMGLDLINTATSSLDLISSHLSRIRDLCEQACNGTYGADSINAIKQETQARVDEIKRLYSNTEYNGEKILEQSYKFLSTVTELVPNVVVTNPEQLASAISNNAVIGIDNAETLAKLATLVNSGTDCSGKTIVLTSDIDLSAYSSGSGWTPIGTRNKPFKGSFDGQGHIINNLYINSNSSDCGLFGRIDGHNLNIDIRNVGLVNVNVNTIDDNTGSLVGEIEYADISNCYSTGSLKGCDFVGGLIGYCFHVSLYDCYSYADIDGCYSVGGAIGGADSYVNVSMSYAFGDVIGYENMGSFSFDVSTNTNHRGYGQCKNRDGTVICQRRTINNELLNMTINNKSTQLQVGIYSDSSSQIAFESACNLAGIESLVSSIPSSSTLTSIDNLLAKITNKQTELGAVQNRLESAVESIGVNIENLTSSRSTLRDADVAEVSSDYIKMQILQQASATLLSTANQSPSIALQLI